MGNVQASCRHVMLASLTMVAAGAVAQEQPQQEPAELAPVTVTATMSEHDARTAPATVTIISSEEIARRNASDLLEAVRGTSGITLSPRGVGGRKTLSMRGMEGRHVLTLIDGRRISSTDDVVGHSDYQYGWLPMAAVERIEIIRGPMSTLYGSEALGGVINLITRKPTDRWEGSVVAGAMVPLDGGGGMGASTSFYLAGPASDMLSLRAFGQFSRAPGVADPDDSRYNEIESTKVRMGGVGGTLRFTAEQSLDLHYSRGQEDRDYHDVSSADVAHSVHYDLDREQAEAAWRGDFAGWRGQLRAYQSSIDIHNSKTAGQSPTRPQFLRDRVVDGHASATLGRHTLTGGAEWRLEYLENSGLAGGNDDAEHQALFLQDEIVFSENLTFMGGVRHDHHQIFGSEVSPRAYLVWSATPELVIKGGYGHAFKAPTLKQISPGYVGAEGPHTFLGNANIQPEKLDSFELSADWQGSVLGLRAAVFRSKVRDLIVYRLISQSGSRRTYMYDNVDRARISGLEAGFTWDISPVIAWSADATLLRTRDLSTGEQLNNRPRLSFNSHADWTGPYGWSARVGVEHIGRQQDSTGELPSYQLWNASVAREFGRAYAVRLSVENIGNVRLADITEQFGYAERGIRACVTLSANF